MAYGLKSPISAVTRVLALLLLVLRVLADDHNLALAADDLALLADRLNRRSYLHVILPPSNFDWSLRSIFGGMGHRETGDHWRSGHMRASARFAAPQSAPEGAHRRSEAKLDKIRGSAVDFIPRHSRLERRPSGSKNKFLRNSFL